MLGQLASAGPRAVSSGRKWARPWVAALVVITGRWGPRLLGVLSPGVITTALC